MRRAALLRLQVSRRFPAAYGFRSRPALSFVGLVAESQLDDEVIGVAPVDGAGELDDLAAGKVGDAFDVEAGRARRGAEQGRLGLVQILRRKALYRAHRAMAGLVQRGI